jgi:hypothetical protein
MPGTVTRASGRLFDAAVFGVPCLTYTYAKPRLDRNMAQFTNGLSERRIRLLLLAIIILSLALRFGFVSTLEEDLYWPDPQYYDEVAWKLVSGEPLEDSVRRAPFQSFVMAVPYAVAGHSYRAAYFFQAFLGGLIPLLVFLIGTRLRNAAVGLLAALLSAIYPYYVYIAGTLYATQTSTILLLLVVYLAIRTRDAKEGFTPVLQGLALGALILTRSIALLFVPIAFLWTFPKRGLVSALIVALVAIAVVAPWTIRNYSATGEFIPVSVGGGREFLYGVAPGATGSSQSRTPIPEEISDELRGLPHGAWDRACLQYGVEFVKDAPGRYMKLYGAKLLNLYRFYPGTISENEFTGSKTKWISILSYGPVLILGLLGIWIERKRWRDYIPLLATIAGFSLIYPLFTTCVRYRLPIDACFIVFAAVALAVLAGRVNDRLGRFFGTTPSEGARV